MRTRLILLLLGAPLLVMLVVMFLWIRHDAQVHANALQQRLTDSAELLAPALSDAIERNATSTVDELAQRMLDLDEVRSLSIHDRSGQAILQLGQRQTNRSPPEPSDETHIDRNDALWQLHVPLSSEEQVAPNHWLSLDIDTSLLTLGIYRHLTLTALVGLVIGLILFLVAYLSSRRLARPFSDARQALLHLNAGDYQYRMQAQGARESEQLAAGINALAEHLAKVNDDMHRHIEQTTQDLQESLETIEIKNIELDMAHRRALEANRIKTEFLANMSHEIRTPLNGIIGFCQLLARSRLDSRQCEWLEHVHKASTSLLSLINDILDFSKIEAGKLEFVAVDLDMMELVDEVLGLQAPEAHQKQLQLLGLVYDDVPVQLQGDPLRIKQVLTNLVHNAIKFTERGEVIVRVMVEEYQANQVTLKVSVSDTGIGLDPASRERLFKAFSQISNSDTRQYGGTGLGLMICRQLVEQMGGAINVDSQPGQGTTFSFSLPLLVKKHEERQPELSLSGTPVALYEPHVPTRHALQYLLECWEAQVTLLDEPRITRGTSPELLVVGLQNDELHDYTLIEWQACFDSAGCPAILLVNANSPDIPSIELTNGGEILTRPLSRVLLASTIKKLLATHSIPPPQGVSAANETTAKVLVVDDTASNRLLIKELLADMGLDALLAASGEEALALAQSKAADLVLMDIRLPGMDGVATSHALRKLGGAWRHCPIIAVTAHALEEERRRLLQHGLHDVLIKPVDGHELARLLSQHLNISLLLPSASPEKMTDTPQTNPEGELPIVDMGLGATLAGGNASLAEQTLRLLLGSLDDSETDLRRAWEAGDAEAFLDAIHALNGACRYCGVPQLALIAETLETRLRTRGLAKVEPLLDELFDAMERLRTWASTEAIQDERPSSTTKAQAKSSSSLNDK